MKYETKVVHNAKDETITELGKEGWIIRCGVCMPARAFPTVYLQREMKE